MNKNIKKENRRLFWRGLCITLIIGLSTMVGGLVAKYRYEKSEDKIAAAKEFYFSSNLLTESGKDYILNSNASSVSFTLGNNIDELRYSDDSIEYSITIEMVEGEDVNHMPSLSQNQGTLENGSISIDTITLNDLRKNTKYKVTAIGEAGYTKTLSATFIVSNDEENVYKFLDTSSQEFVLLTVWTENTSGIATIEVKKDGLIPDNTDPAMGAINNFQEDIYQTFSFTDMESFYKTYSSRTYRFFIDSKADAQVKDFVVTIDDGQKSYLAEANTP